MSEALPTLWFVLIAVLWAGYLFLEGFDLGVGMLMKLTYRTDSQRRVLLNTVGPVWDGNEVWLITAIGATFAAFPAWYASLLSTLYLPFTAVLLGLIFRAVAFEWRGKVDSAAWRNRWDWAIALGSLTAAAGIGAALALTTTGLPINANGDREGGPFAWFTGYALLGAAAVVLFCLVHAAAFLALKTEGGVRHTALRVVRRLLPFALLPMLAWALVVQVRGGTALTAAALVLAACCAAASWGAARRDRDGRAFAALGGALVLTVGSIFAAAFPVVLPSTLDPLFDLTVESAASSPYTLGLMSVVAAFGLPLILAYQGWTYWVFRRRISERSIPAAHAVTPL
ncbi:cytochrome d ubiquinol oxidase subunit II [Arthrobacter sp. TMN-37]